MEINESHWRKKNERMKDIKFENYNTDGQKKPIRLANTFSKFYMINTKLIL